MSQDQIIEFQSPRTKPSRENVGLALTDYLGGIGKVTSSGSRFIVDLPGRPSCPERNLTEGGMQKQACLRSARWFEVCVELDHIDVLTRDQDAFTCALATGFAEFCRWFWGSQ